MEEIKQRSISRILEEKAIYESIEEGLSLVPDDMRPIHLYLVRTILKNLNRTIECVEKNLPM